MARISQRRIQHFLTTGDNAATTAVKGRAFEELICYLFSKIPGISVTRRNTLNQFGAEENRKALHRDPESSTLKSRIALSRESLDMQHYVKGLAAKFGNGETGTQVLIEGEVGTSYMDEGTLENEFEEGFEEDIVTDEE